MIPITPRLPREHAVGGERQASDDAADRSSDQTGHRSSDHARASGRRPVPAALVVLLALGGALALGSMGQAAGEGAFRGSREFARLGGPWLIAGFAGGAIAGWRRGWSGLAWGVIAGAIIVGFGSIAYYGLSYWAGGNDAYRAAKLGIGWGAAGIGVGGTLGLLGAAYSTTLGRHQPRRGGRPVASWVHGAALGTLGGLLIGEAVALLWVWEGANLRTMAALEGIGGFALVVAGSIGRSWRFVLAALTFAALTATVAPAATTLLRDALRTVGWAGA